jgi:hypothetical protein
MQIMYRCWSGWLQQQEEQQQQQSSFHIDNSDTTTSGVVVGNKVDVSWILLLPNTKIKDRIMGPKVSAFNHGFLPVWNSLPMFRFK